jgi:hypothetical protein
MSFAKNKRRAKKLLGYTEFHHIIPQSVGPQFKDHLENVVALSAKEHFVVHLLLTKMFDNPAFSNKMKFAFKRMRHDDTGLRYTSPYYSKLRLTMPPVNLGKVHVTNGYDTRFLSVDSAIPDGWFLGAAPLYKKRRKAINARLKKSVKVIDMHQDASYVISNLKQWCVDNSIPYSTVSSAIRSSHTVRGRYQLAYVAA